MALGTSLFLLAIGAILRFAVYYSIHGIALNVVGIVLMVVGALGLILSIVLGMTPWSTGRGYPSRQGPTNGPVGPTSTYEERTYVEQTGPRV